MCAAEAGVSSVLGQARTESWGGQVPSSLTAHSDTVAPCDLRKTGLLCKALLESKLSHKKGSYR